ncbi:hypothetical protein O1D97_02910 [Marinomonas sp. 15G1-11]|uniref:Uncharacterized protein n=1 Tax=Marinomonas phaeophyticola TaxID=3004091 RepID=A0ABT4JQL3_9GAMM|nr:hypothetical protein [Marinomonas sp. 15G1-11]MCZ2720619.1 hypothetical protein [Marinomonas sp. 15G1-11]
MSSFLIQLTSVASFILAVVAHNQLFLFLHIPVVIYILIANRPV